jgi:hypothetical protein
MYNRDLVLRSVCIDTISFVIFDAPRESQAQIEKFPGVKKTPGSKFWLGLF